MECLLSFGAQCFVFRFCYPKIYRLTLSLLMCIYGRDFLLGILFLEPCISLIYACKVNKYNSYSFSLLIMYGSSYMFRHYISIFGERSLVPSERCSIEEQSIEYCG